MLLSLLAARSTRGMDLPTLSGTSACTPMPTNEFEIYRSGESTHPTMSLVDLYPTDQYRVVVAGFYYADREESVRLSESLQAVVQELNEALGEHTVAGVALNNMLPMECARRLDDEEQCTEEELSEDSWQGKIENVAPEIPVVQDTKSLDAWNYIFGAGRNDLLVYVDGFVYKYLPAEENAKQLNLFGGDYLDTNLLSDEGYSNFMDLILNLLQSENETSRASVLTSKCVMKNGYPENNDEMRESRSKTEGHVVKSVAQDPLISTVVGFLTASTIVCIAGVAWYFMRRVVIPEDENKMSRGGGFKSISQSDSDGDYSLHEDIELSKRDSERDLNSLVNKEGKKIKITYI